MDAIPSYSGDSTEYIETLRNWLHKHQSDFTKETNNNDYAVQNLFGFALGQAPEGCPLGDWNYIQLMIFTFFCVIPPSEIPASAFCIGFRSDSASVFHALTHLFSVKKEVSPEEADVLGSIFEDFGKQILERDEHLQYGDLSSISYGHLIPKLLIEKCETSIVCNLFAPFILRFVSTENLKCYTDSELVFISDILKHLTTLNDPRITPDLLQTIFQKIFSSSQISPWAKIAYFYPIWKMEKARHRASLDPSGEQGRLISEVYEVLANCSSYEMPKNFQWNFAFQLFEMILKEVKYRIKSMHFICKTAANMQRIDLIHRFDSLANPFVVVLSGHWREGQPIHLYYYMNSVKSILDTRTGHLHQIKGLQFKNRKKAYVSYAEQIRDKKQMWDIDKDLMTKFDCVYVDTQKEADDFIEEQWKKLEPIAKRFPRATNFTLTEVFEKFTIEEYTSRHYSYMMCYVQSVVRAWMYFIMLYCHRMTMLQYFIANMQASGTQSVAVIALRRAESPQFINKFVDAVRLLPDSLTDIVADVILDVLDDGIREKICTYQFLNGCLGLIMWRAPIAKAVIAKMNSRTHELMNLFTRIGWSNSFYAHQWILIMIRLATPPDESMKNEYLDNHLYCAQRLFFTGLLLYIKNATAHKLVINAAEWYKRGRERNTKDQRNDRSKAMRFRRTIVDEINQFARIDALPVFMDPSTCDVSGLGFPFVSQFLTLGLQSNNRDIYQTCISTFIEIADKAVTQKPFDPDVELYGSMMKAYFNVIAKDDIESAVTVARTVPKRVQTFVKQPKPQKNSQPALMLDEYECRIEELLDAIITGWSDSPEEAPILFNMTVKLFAYVKEQYTTQYYLVGSVIEQLVRILALLLKFENIHEKVLKLFRSLNKFFMERESIDKKSYYLLALIINIGQTRSEICDYLCMIMSEYLKACSLKSVPSKVLSTAIYDLFEVANPPFTHFMFLFAISTIAKYYPDALSFDHFTITMTTCSMHYLHDSRNAQLLKDVMVACYNVIGPEDQKKMIDLVFNRVYLMPNSYRITIIATAASFNHPLDLPDLDSILNISDEDIFVTKLTTFLCLATSASVTLSHVTRTRLMNIVANRPKTPRNAVMDHIARVLVIIFGLTSRKDVFHAFCENDDFIKRIMNILSSTLSEKFPLHRSDAKIIFTTLVTKYTDEPKIIRYLHQVAVQVESNLMFLLELHNDKPFLHYHLIKLMPTLSSSTAAVIFFDAFTEYYRRGSRDRMSLLRSYFNILKHLGIKRYMQREDVRRVVLMRNPDVCNGLLSYVERFITQIIRLFDDDANPVLRDMSIKYVRQILVNFSRETVDFIVRDIRSPIEFGMRDKGNHTVVHKAYELLYHVIVNDPDNVMLGEYLQRLSVVGSSLMRMHPEALLLMKRLLKSDRKFIKMDIVTGFIRMLFQKLLCEYSAIHECGDHGYYLMTLSAELYLELIKSNMGAIRECSVDSPESQMSSDILTFCSLFNHHPFMKSGVYMSLKRILFEKKDNLVFSRLFGFLSSILLRKDAVVAYGLIPSLLKVWDNIPVCEEQEIWTLAYKLALEDGHLLVGISIIYRLVSKPNPIPDQIPKIVSLLPQLVKHTDQGIVITGIKIAISLVSLDMMPLEVYQLMLTYLLSSNRMFDPPFSPYTQKLIKTKQEMNAPVTIELCEAVNTFVLEFFPYLRESSKLYMAVQSAPLLFSKLPFSLMLVLNNTAKMKLKQASKQAKIEADNFFIMGIKMCQLLESTRQERDEFFGYCFEHICTVKQPTTKDFCEQLCLLMIKSDGMSVRPEMMRIVSLIGNDKPYLRKAKFWISIVAVKFFPPDILMEFKSVIHEILGYLGEEETSNITLTNILAGRIFRERLLWDEFSSDIYGVIDRNLTVDARDQKIEFVGQFIQVCVRLASCTDYIHPMEFVKHFWSFTMDLPHENESQLAILIRHCIQLLDDIPECFHREYIDEILDRVSQRPEDATKFVQFAHTFFKSKTTMVSNRMLVLDALPSLLNRNTVSMLGKLANMIVDDLSEQNPSELYKVIPILVYHAVHTTCTERIHITDRIMELLGPTPCDRFMQLKYVLPLKMWRDNYIAYISFLISGERSQRYSLLAFSHSMKTCSKGIFMSTMKDIPEDDRDSVLNDLLTQITRDDYSRKYRTFVAVAMELLGTKLMPRVIYDIAKCTDSLCIMTDLLEHVEPYGRLVKPGAFGDTVFGYLLPQTDQKGALAQYFLGNYTQAQNMFTKPSNSWESKIMQCCSTFTIEHDVYRRFASPTNPDLGLLELRSAFDAVRSDDKPTALRMLAEAEFENIAFLKRQKCPILYEKHRFAAVQNIINIMRTTVEGGEHAPCLDYFDRFSLLPAFQDVIERTKSMFIPGYRSISEIEEAGDSTIVTLPGTFTMMFDKISGYTPHGMIAVTVAQLESAITTVNTYPSDRIVSQKWAAFAFHMFMLHPDVVMFEAALRGYLNVVSLHDNYPAYIKYEATARVLVLLKLSNSLPNHDIDRLIVKYKEPILASVPNPLSFWVFQILDLRVYPWFQTHLYPMLNELSTLTALYAIENKPFEEFMTSMLNEKTMIFMNEMNCLRNIELFFDYLFSEDAYTLLEQRKVMNMLISLKNNPLQKQSDITWEQIRRDPSMGQIYRIIFSMRKNTLSFLSLFTPKAIADMMNDAELEEVVDKLLPGKVPFAEAEKRLKSLIAGVNESLSFPVPCSIHTYKNAAIAIQQSNMLMCRDDIDHLQDDTFTVQFVTTINPKYSFRITKRASSSTTTRTFSCLMNIIKRAMNASFITQSRNMMITSPVEFILGPKYTMTTILGGINSICDYFCAATGHTSVEWIADATSHGRITAKGEEMIKQLPDTALLSHLTHNFSVETYQRTRMAMLRSCASSLIVRTIFSSGYQDMESLLFSSLTGELPILVQNMHISADVSASSHMRLSPNMVRFMGPTMHGEIIISVGAVCQVIMQNLNSVRAGLETAILDTLQPSACNVDELLRIRDHIETKISAFTPPHSPSATPEDTERWFDNVSELVSSAMDASKQPLAAIPWF